ncbi:uncharacterized protein LOC112256101 isoform X4 [Oncorhynchus tshawytscha]|uniref:uncharacterized protein LOC121838660 isoform X4 n=1 Tax=Oncorhynchus tshawytscha TaxID=74940 RepID=UPI001C3CDC45|nr:uncharacterized protein LOC121838660 isoform X4 [Oncorhynchus tshawytscha]XP_042181763.1 uncharacterized protein LOC112256101 isoform X4 [Oncorhynchus tshawytscha]
MLVVFGLLVMLTGLSNGTEEKSCDARQNMSCHGALGETVYLQLMNNATGSELIFKKDPTAYHAGESYGTVIGSLVAVVLVLTVVVGPYCIHKRRTPSQIPDADESPELEYADINILKKMEKHREVPEDVEYGQVVVLKGSRPTTERDRPEGREETVYAGIQLDQ